MTHSRCFLHLQNGRKFKLAESINVRYQSKAHDVLSNAIWLFLLKPGWFERLRAKRAANFAQDPQFTIENAEWVRGNLSAESVILDIDK